MLGPVLLRLDLLAIIVIYLYRQDVILSSRTYQIDSALENRENLYMNDKPQRNLARLTTFLDSAFLFFNTKKKTLLVSLNDQEFS
jgi:hypothetical protein